jgi:type IV secretory pathway TrbL component
MQLQLAGASLSGTASGKFQSSATTVTVAGASGASAVATGIVVGPANVSGLIDCSVSVQGLSCTNNGHTWLLAPR